jgi:hypothetical protein
MTDILVKLSEADCCYQCGCLSCEREGYGENHDHVCTAGEHCKFANKVLRIERRNLIALCRDASNEIRDLRRVLNQ